METIFKKDKYGIPKTYRTITYFGVALMGFALILKHYHFYNYTYILIPGVCIGVGWMVLCLVYTIKYVRTIRAKQKGWK